MEPYNSILSLNTLQEDVDGVHLFDNDALGRLCMDKLGISNPTFDDINELISDVMSAITSSLRFPGQHNTSLQKQMTNLMPDPKYHLFMCAHAPLRSMKRLTCNTNPNIITTTAELTNDIFKPQSMMLSSAYRKSEKILAAAAIFRGAFATREVEESMFQVQTKEPYRFADYLVNSIQTSVCNIPPTGIPLSITCVANSSLVSDTIRHTLNAASTLFTKQAYLHYYDNTIGDRKCIQASIHAMETVQQNYLNLECPAPSDRPLRKPRAMRGGCQLPKRSPNAPDSDSKLGSRNDFHQGERRLPSVQLSASIDGRSTTTTNSTLNAWSD